MTAALMAATATTAGAAAAHATPTPPCALASERPLPVGFTDQAPPATAILRRLAGQLRTVPADTQIGAYAYTRVTMQAAVERGSEIEAFAEAYHALSRTAPDIAAAMGAAAIVQLASTHNRYLN